MTENTTSYGNDEVVVRALDRVTRAILTGALVDAVQGGNGQLVTLVIDALRGDEPAFNRAVKGIDSEWLRFE